MTKRAIVAATVAVWTITAAAMIALPKAGAVEYCTPQIPYAPYGSVCTGYGNYCYINGLNCSTIPGKPGTMNPDGYTPVCNTSSRCPWE